MDYNYGTRQFTGLYDHPIALPRIRAYELAKEIGCSNKTLISTARDLGITIDNHMSKLDDDDIRKIKEYFAFAPKIT